MPLNFSHTPNIGDVLLVNGITYVWNVANATAQTWFTNFPGLCVATGNAYQDANGIWYISSADVSKQGDFMVGDLVMQNANIYFAFANNGVFWNNGNSGIFFANGQLQITGNVVINGNVYNGSGGGGGGGGLSSAWAFTNVGNTVLLSSSGADTFNVISTGVITLTNPYGKVISIGDGGVPVAAFNQANTARTTGNNAYDTGNAAFKVANSAFNLASNATSNSMASTLVLRDSVGNINVSNISANTVNVQWIDFYGQQTDPPFQTGRVWNDLSGDNTGLNYDSEISGVTIRLGHSVVHRCVNKTSGWINIGSVVYMSGATGQIANVNLACANNLSTSQVVGMVFGANLAPNSGAGYVMEIGKIINLNTSAYGQEGTELWLSATTPGALTNTEPSAPNYPVSVGFVLYQHATQGQVLIKPHQDETGTNLTNNSIAFASTSTLIEDNANLRFDTSNNTFYTNKANITTLKVSAIDVGATIPPSYNAANAAFAKANAALTTMSVSANTPTGNTITPATVVFGNTANIYWSTSGTSNITPELTTTGVTAGIYGNATVIPIITIDSHGRVTSVTNVNASAPASTVNTGASLMFTGGSNSTYYFTGYAPKALTVVGARAFTTSSSEQGKTANVTITINGTNVTGLVNIQANTLNTVAIINSTGNNSVVAGDRIMAVVSNNTLDSANNIVVSVLMQ